MVSKNEPVLEGIRCKFCKKDLDVAWGGSISNAIIDHLWKEHLEDDGVLAAVLIPLTLSWIERD